MISGLLKSNKSNKQIGATMAEFALAFPIILLMILFLVDTGVLLFKHSLLTDATAALTRAVTTNIGQNQANGAKTCASQVIIAKQSLTDLRAAHGELFKDMTFELTMSPSSADEPYQLISIHGTFPLNCLLCKFYPATINLNHNSVLAIERQYSCSPLVTWPQSLT